MSQTIATRQHEIHCGHRVVGHQSKCRHLHGHSYVFTMHCIADNRKLNDLGMVLDFGDIKRVLCQWLEDNWDHKFLYWDEDTLIRGLELNPGDTGSLERDEYMNFCESLVELPFNPTAENIAEYFVTIVAPGLLAGTGITLQSCTVNETSKCSATFTLGE